MKKFVVSEESLQRNDDGSYLVKAVTSLKEYIPPEYNAISPLDGRYHEIGETLSPYFSEYALVKNRVMVEVTWLQFILDNMRDWSPILRHVIARGFRKIPPKMMPIARRFDYDDFMEIKKIEEEINHDVKSVELWVAKKVEEMGFPELKSYVHIGCTSEDITNCAYGMMISGALNNVWIPDAENLIQKLKTMVVRYKDVPMLAHTHGQPATPTTVGKELGIYYYRLSKVLEKVKNVKIFAKFNGATGNYAAINVAFPNRYWNLICQNFIENYLELDFNPVTTQIEPHDYIVEIGNEISHFNRIVCNLCRDMRTYIMLGYFSQKVVDKEVGSSTMPNKVNPIDFENGEGNLYKSTYEFNFLSDRLMESWMQRDLRDSTTLRNLGTAFGSSVLGITKTVKGLLKSEPNTRVLSQDLDTNWEVLAEAIQTVLRKYGISDAYDKLKELTRGKKVTREDIQSFLMSDTILQLPQNERAKLMALTPKDYTGMASEIVVKYIIDD